MQKLREITFERTLYVDWKYLNFESFLEFEPPAHGSPVIEV